MPGLINPLEALVEVEALVPQGREYGFDVVEQKVSLNIDFSTQTVTGTTDIIIMPNSKDLKVINLDARQCEINPGRVMVNGHLADSSHEDYMEALHIPKAYNWTANQHQLQKERIKPLDYNSFKPGGLAIEIPAEVEIEEENRLSEKAATPLQQRSAGIRVSTGDGNAASSKVIPVAVAEGRNSFKTLKISISFSTKSFTDGLHFVGFSEGDARFPYVYSRHSVDPGTASCIFPCVDDSSMRCSWDISIRCSRTLGDAVKRKPAAPRNHKNTHLGKRDRSGTVVKVDEALEEYEVPLGEDEKLLEMTAVCSGELVAETTDNVDSTKKIMQFKCFDNVSAGQIGFAVGPFESVDLSEYREDEDGEKLGQSQATKIIGYCLPGRADEIRHTCAPLAHAIDFFSLNFGSYPFPYYSLVFVDDQIRPTEHLSSMTLCSTRLLFSEDIIEPEVESVRALVHAIATQWFGVSIVPKERPDRWITVGLAYYMAGLFMKALCGNNDYFFRQKTLTDRLLEQDIEKPSLFALGETLHLGSWEYDFMALKAPLVLFILDKRIVKASGGAGLARVMSRIIVAANTGSADDRILNTKDFRRLVEKVTKYRQTEPFWNQWVYGSGCPRFKIDQSFNKKRMCVQLLITQLQDRQPTVRQLKRSSFSRELKEELQGIYAGEMQPLFTGAMTIRIHEADGTPYEHMIEIKEQNQRIEIPYNTKYKRLKRSKRQKERLIAGGAADTNGEGGEDALYYCLGDVLQSQEDVDEYDLSDWQEDVEKKMAGESWEWIRVDADFEWLCHKELNQPSYMWISQLQQDRDVVAQQEALSVFMTPDFSTPNRLLATFLIRTLMDTRYFHGIRTHAAALLSHHADPKIQYVGYKQLAKAYGEFYCYPGGKTPRPNDFSDKRAYWVEASIPKSMSRIRDFEGKCPKFARQFIIDILQFNDNGNNEYSDVHKISNLLSCLAESLIPYKSEAVDIVLDNSAEEDDDEPEQFKKDVLAALDRYQRMDEWEDSYHNILTTTVLDCKKRLMEAKVIPVEGADFVQYLRDGTADLIRIKAFKCLIELGFLKNDAVASLLLNVLSTDSSPFVRHNLFEVFCLGLAGIALAKEPEPAPTQSADGDGMVVENVDAVIARRRAQELRTTTILGALAALKEELKFNEVIKKALWKAISSPLVGEFEQSNLLDICDILYDAVKTLILNLKLPRYWEAKKAGKRGVIVFTQTGRVRSLGSKPKAREQTPVSPPLPDDKMSQPTILPLSPPPAAAAPVKSGLVKSGPVKLSLSTNNGSMKPPKRPAPVDGISSTERPPTKRSKVVKLKVPSQQIQGILIKPPNPAPVPKRVKISPSSRNSPTPTVKISSSLFGSPASLPPKPYASSTSGSTIAASPAPASPAPAQSSVTNPPPTKVRKALPDSGRKPLPDAPAAVRKPLPDSSGRKLLPDSSATRISSESPSAAPKKIKLKLKRSVGP